MGNMCNRGITNVGNIYQSQQSLIELLVAVHRVVGFIFLVVAEVE